MCRWCTRTCFQGSGTGGCEELCLGEGDHHELVLLGEEHGQGGVWAVSWVTMVFFVVKGFE